MPFEDELGEALRRAGDGFTADRHALVEAGERRGRRLVARRRAAVIGGSVLSLALIGAVGAYAGGLLDGSGRVEIAAPPEPSGGRSGGGGGGAPELPPGGTGAVSAAQLVELFKELLPGGTLSVEHANGTDGHGAGIAGVYDDGKGAVAIKLTLVPVDPNGGLANNATLCRKKDVRPDDACTTEQLADGSRLLTQQGYLAQSPSIDIKEWRAALVTPQGFQVELSETNAPRMETTKSSRPNPPLSPAQLRAVVTSDKWQPALNDMPPAARLPGRTP
ncbi:hypothetical protein [Streptomyces vinaceus]|uniref:hypothetical protein n=1 Tax=Streptomyces vinaceus TaxID=1960 RepID=UPI0016744F0B|nr:hypothetical protein [Streptomyces vinaceus]GHE73538.1 hypothetical protein GCM10017778_68530 [Streptomyces vinaceus]